MVGRRPVVWAPPASDSAHLDFLKPLIGLQSELRSRAVHRIGQKERMNHPTPKYPQSIYLPTYPSRLPGMEVGQ